MEFTSRKYLSLSNGIYGLLRGEGSDINTIKTEEFNSFISRILELNASDRLNDYETIKLMKQVIDFRKEQNQYLSESNSLHFYDTKIAKAILIKKGLAHSINGSEFVEDIRQLDIEDIFDKYPFLSKSQNKHSFKSALLNDKVIPNRIGETFYDNGIGRDKKIEIISELLKTNGMINKNNFEKIITDMLFPISFFSHKEAKDIKSDYFEILDSALKESGIYQNYSQEKLLKEAEKESVKLREQEEETLRNLFNNDIENSIREKNYNFRNNLTKKVSKAFNSQVSQLTEEEKDVKLQSKIFLEKNYPELKELIDIVKSEKINPENPPLIVAELMDIIKEDNNEFLVHTKSKIAYLAIKTYLEQDYNEELLILLLKSQPEHIFKDNLRHEPHREDNIMDVLTKAASPMVIKEEMNLYRIEELLSILNKNIDILDFKKINKDTDNIIKNMLSHLDDSGVDYLSGDKLINLNKNLAKQNLVSSYYADLQGLFIVNDFIKNYSENEYESRDEITQDVLLRRGESDPFFSINFGRLEDNQRETIDILRRDNYHSILDDRYLGKTTYFANLNKEITILSDYINGFTTKQDTEQYFLSNQENIIRLAKKYKHEGNMDRDISDFTLMANYILKDEINIPNEIVENIGGSTAIVLNRSQNVINHYNKIIDNNTISNTGIVDYMMLDLGYRGYDVDRYFLDLKNTFETRLLPHTIEERINKINSFEDNFNETKAKYINLMQELHEKEHKIENNTKNSVEDDLNRLIVEPKQEKNKKKENKGILGKLFK